MNNDIDISINTNDLTLINEALHELTMKRGLQVVLPVSDLIRKINLQTEQKNKKEDKKE